MMQTETGMSSCLHRGHVRDTVVLAGETFLAKVEWEDGWPVINPGIGHLTEKTELPIGEYRLEREVTHADFIAFDQKK